LRKFEDILVQYSRDVEATRFNIEDGGCILGSTGYQATLSPSEQWPVPPCGADSWKGGCNKMAVPSL